MNFVLIAHDFEDALDRRMAVREDHLTRTKESKKNGFIDYVVALKDEKDGHLNGSVMVFNCDDKSEIENYLNGEPYMLNNVWKDIKIYEGAVPQL